MKSSNIIQQLLDFWISSLCNGLHINPENFRPYYSRQNHIADTKQLWQALDALPNKKKDSPSYFSEVYQIITSALPSPPKQESNLKKLLGAQYDHWNKFIKSKGLTEDHPDAIRFFSQWAAVFAPDKMHLVGKLSQSAMHPLNKVTKNVEEDNKKAGTFAYNVGYGTLEKNLNNASSLEFNVSTSQLLEATHSKINPRQKVNQLFPLEDVNGIKRFLNLYNKMALNASFGSITTLAGAPLAHKSKEEELKMYEPWFNSAILNKALNSENEWENKTLSWESIFGPEGSLEFVNTALVIARDIQLDLSIKGEINPEDKDVFIETIQQNGFWPIFTAPQPFSDITIQENEGGSIQITINSSPGQAFLLGTISRPLKSLLN